MTLKPSPQDWHSIGTGHANTTPIRVTKPRLVKGTSTIQRRLLSGQHHFRTTLRCRHNVNPRTIKCQSVISMMPTMCQSNANPLTIRQSNFTRTMSKTPSANHEKNHHRWRVNPRFDTGDQLVSNLGTSLLKGTDRSVSTEEDFTNIVNPM